MPTKKEAPTTSSEIQQVDTSIFELFGGPEFRGGVSIIQFPEALFLNQCQAPGHGLFIKQQSWLRAMPLTDWEPNYQHQFAQATESTAGYLFHGCESMMPDSQTIFPRPLMQILYVSDIYIEITKDFTDGNAPVGLNGKELLNPITGGPLQKRDLIGIYDLNNPTPLYELLKKQGCATLRTFYIFRMFGERNGKIVPLHEIPIKLSIKGAAAKSFADAYSNWRLTYARLYAEATQTPVAYDWKPQFFIGGLFCPILETQRINNPRGSGSSLVTGIREGSVECRVITDKDAVINSLSLYTSNAFDVFPVDQLAGDFHQVLMLPEAEPTVLATGEDFIDVPSA